MSRNNPLPVSLQQECRKAGKIFASFADPVNGLDNVIPPSILRKAKGFAFITIVKAGFVFSARAGTGVVIARLKDGSWSAPSAVGTAGLGAGFQGGVEITEFMIILNSSAAVRSFMTKGSITVGGNMSVSAGPLGRNVEGTGTLSAKGGVSAMYSYSRSKGLFGGASIEGSIIVERSDANSKAYGFNVTAKQLLSGSVELPRWAEELGETIKRRSGRDNRIPGWIEDGDEISTTREGEWHSDEEEEGREVFRDEGLTPREYGEKGYSFGSQYASGGSHLANSKDSAAGGGASSPNRSRSGSGTSKFGGMLGSLSGGRSRSGSGASSTVNNYNSSSYNNGYQKEASGGPANGDGPNFATKFESDYEPSSSSFSASRPRSTSSPLRSPPLTKKDFSLIDAQDPFSETNAISDPPLQASASSSTAPPVRPGFFKRMSSSSVSGKLTKSRSGSGTGSVLRERAGQMNWSTFENNNDSREDFPSSSNRNDPSRDSFESLDNDDDGDNSKFGDNSNRKRASTISGSSNPTDTLSSYHRPPLPSSGNRPRSFTSPFGGGGAPFSKKNKSKKPEYTAYNDPNRDGLYPIQSNDSNNTREYEFDEPEYSTKKTEKLEGGRKRGDSNPKPWDSEDEDFINDSIKPVRPSPSLAKSTSSSGRDAFDFRQVEADFASVADGKGLRGRSGTITSTRDEEENENGNGRSRSGTLTAQTSSKGAIGTAIARYDFRGVESTDLPFLKGDVLVILNNDDEEWYKARLKLREGMIPRNYLSDIEWY
ncbi:uncharacterized protein JCM6883_003045 [Sporobolomyces salmoneus]|uniref:uncharacterized protein n=1 Tax=Sporobolomyces salmoneus TaxID=183962 RepID=UPI003179AC5C